MATNKRKNKIKIDNIEYNLDDLSENAKVQLANIDFVDTQLQQLNNEWAVADTALATQTFKSRVRKVGIADRIYGSKNQIRRQAVHRKLE